MWYSGNVHGLTHTTAKSPRCFKHRRLKNSLGQSAEEIIVEDCDTIQEQHQRLTEAEEQERRANALTAEREKSTRDEKSKAEN